MSDSQKNINNKNFGNDDSSFMPTPEKFQAEQDALKKVHDPKDFSEVRPRNDYEDLDDIQEQKPEKIEQVKQVEKFKPPVKKPVEPEKVEQKLEDNIVEPEQQKQTPVVPDKINNEIHKAEFISSDEIDFEEPKKEPPKETTEQTPAVINNEPVIKGSYTPKPKPQSKPKKQKKKVKFVKTLNDDESLFCGLCHLCNVLVVTAIWVPFFLYLTKSDNEKVAFHSIQSILFGAAVIVVLILLGALSSLISGTCGCMVLLTVPFMLLLYLAFWICAIYFSVETFRGFDYKIPYISIAAEKVIEFLTFEE